MLVNALHVLLHHCTSRGLHAGGFRTAELPLDCCKYFWRLLFLWCEDAAGDGGDDDVDVGDGQLCVYRGLYSIEH